MGHQPVLATEQVVSAPYAGGSLTALAVSATAASCVGEPDLPPAVADVEIGGMAEVDLALCLSSRGRLVL